MRRGLGKLWDNFKHYDIQIIGMTEGEEQEQDIQNSFQQIVKENFPNLARK